MGGEAPGGVSDGGMATTQLHCASGDGARNGGDREQRPQRRGGATGQYTGHAIQHCPVAPIGASSPATDTAAATTSRSLPGCSTYSPKALLPSSTAGDRRKSPCPGLYCHMGAGSRKRSEGYEQLQLQSARVPSSICDPSNSCIRCKEAGGDEEDDDEEEVVGEEARRMRGEKCENISGRNETTVPQGSGQEDREAAAEISGSGEDCSTFHLPLKVKMRKLGAGTVFIVVQANRECVSMLSVVKLFVLTACGLGASC